MEKTKISLISIYDINGRLVVAYDEIEAISIFKEYHKQEYPERVVPDIKRLRRVEPQEGLFALIKVKEDD